ncbi:DUF1329 domain-containing protein [Comamonas sp. Y33R10-2]|uniref:DUF1329 domain-containing protein n=1 Tax=Comamonas sp. Y33R10-2 TaxID=2853257 RepID=UPI001C5CAD80|nr:DUF1329 domain-containing protein [Comamonas sp. Y33R10-2]QXZ10361.1 DUF1329 domain-containing protein [Comamonas sp. Y33R10-2]
MKFVTAKTPLAVAVGLLVATSVWAKVPASEAEQLGKELTCVGAIKAGNKDGTIPEFTGKWLGAPTGVAHVQSSGKHPVDIYADEKPLFSITSENMAKYADKLSPGQKAMLQKYSKTYRIPVYAGHRDFRYPDDVCAIAKKNAVEAEVTNGGLSRTGYMGAIGFPIPKNGLEVIWNNLLPFRAYTERTLRDSANVLSDGSATWGRTENTNLDMTSAPVGRGKPVEGVMAYTMNKTLAPQREKGGVTNSIEPVNFFKDKRLAWNYDPGTRRVRQLPEYGFDQPMAGTGGKMTIDSDRLFNGAPERYDWKLIGKQEMFIPANTLKLHQPTVKYADLLKPNHANPDFMRYELRRVWAVEGTLKEGYRHLYGKRVLFVDEDTGQAIASDMYDARGQLWQHAIINTYYSYDLNAWHAGTSFYHDMNSGSYMAYNLFQERPIGPILNKGDLTPNMFTPEAARNAGN